MGVDRERTSKSKGNLQLVPLEPDLAPLGGFTAAVAGDGEGSLHGQSLPSIADRVKATTVNEVRVYSGTAIPSDVEPRISLDNHRPGGQVPYFLVDSSLTGGRLVEVYEPATCAGAFAIVDGKGPFSVVYCIAFLGHGLGLCICGPES